MKSMRSGKQMPRRTSLFRLSPVILCLLAVPACDIVNINDRLLNSADRRITQYSTVPAAAAWASVPGQSTVMQRLIGNEVEQVISLPNATAIPGDNQLLMRASRTGNQAAGRLRLEALRARIGGFPEPFTEVRAQDMMSATDTLGPYSWVTRTFGQTTCVLAVRKLGAEARPIPAGRNALEVVLRNCVSGPYEAALTPIRDTTLAVGGAIGPGPATTPGTRLLSPLTAPLPE